MNNGDEFIDVSVEQLLNTPIANGLVILIDTSDDAIEFLKDDFEFEQALRLLPMAWQLGVINKKNLKSKYISLCNRILQIFGCAILSPNKIKDFKSLSFTTNEYGKPETPGIAFNMSNGDRLVGMFAIRYYSQSEELPHHIHHLHSNQLVGIDIASTNDYHIGDEELFHTIFCPDELELLKSSNPVTTSKSFAHLWSFKECYIKYIGKGLHYDNLSELNFSNHINTPTSNISIDNNPLTFHSKWSNQEVITICYNEPPLTLNNPPNFYILNIKDIISQMNNYI
ncbi:hypothetical protein Kpol_1043p31 [Vanderwaltozyma polyspora DSM 70294]|uniref:holo-[acyl-carrier-protein] synthase n=1 Tax=Vanderwaltozyma polyspora (strain ATCC 22028 / DSM 70294 / BCRC 21397 / CBS 2163 / NBRC 10782 / NRRL Y-8283 / UCD 57-17) TaxID=436907 RepID=A7TIP9_VANPO|nr:uncharacterized protein Kpol_1043p31 [Vanderwaltozyma polyspora DSM 70294]EDO17841.1 hypothetical protein Kpol_1043p31 [Vanderwaltozyma polyspora DSM 70294]